ncbi:MAG: hypothetical protein ACE5GJ_05180 [Gemmatimonadota bacterium]
MKQANAHFRLPSGRRLLVRFLILSAAALGSQPAAATAQHPWSALSAEMQVRLALQAAPKDLRETAAVQGYDADGAFVTLRQGEGPLICMAPAPAQKVLEVSCHYRGLEPFFARGRELLAQGITGEERARTRWREYTAGTLPIPYGSINYIVVGSGFDPETGEVRDSYTRWTIYTPGATPETTGITGVPGPGSPWLMFPGTPGAHIMIVPRRPGTASDGG